MLLFIKYPNILMDLRDNYSNKNTIKLYFLSKYRTVHTFFYIQQHFWISRLITYTTMYSNGHKYYFENLLQKVHTIDHRIFYTFILQGNARISKNPILMKIYGHMNHNGLYVEQFISPTF